MMAGCPATVDEGGTEGSSSSGGEASGSTSTNGDTSGESSTSAASTTTTAADSSSTGEVCADVVPVENPEMYNCSLVDQDCPACHKCTHAWDGDNEVHPLESGTVCVPVDPNPVDLYQPCSYGEGPGLDDCGADAFCWSPDEATTDGYCVAFCGPEETCPEGSLCSFGGDGDLGCIPSCDPFAPDCPDASEECLFLVGYSEFATCVGGPSGSPTEVGDECHGWCGEGLGCVSAEVFGPGCAFDECCTALCDADHACSNPEQTCLGECAQSPEGISVCGVPLPPDPMQCPPDDAEPNYPWCSAIAGCDESWGGGNDCVDVCFCHLQCETPADCPVPATGNPTLECERVIDGGSCVLSCANGETCPDGMYCDDELYPGTCMWFVELEPGCTQG